MGSIGRAVSKPFEKAIGGVAEAVGLKAKAPSVTIEQDPAETAAATLQANLGADLSNDNTPTIQSGGQVTSASDTLSRRRRGTTGVSSGLGIGV